MAKNKRVKIINAAAKADATIKTLMGQVNITKNTYWYNTKALEVVMYKLIFRV